MHKSFKTVGLTTLSQHTGNEKTPLYLQDKYNVNLLRNTIATKTLLYNLATIEFLYLA